jgi:fermentation-respiration switch protein FrsA (DUF1100 family)
LGSVEGDYYLLIRCMVKTMQMVMKTVGWTVLLYVIYCAVLFAVQRQMIFPRGLVAHGQNAPRDNLHIEIITLESGGSVVESWYLPPVSVADANRSPALIFAHGNAELIDFCVAEMQPLTALGIGVLLVEYPGYGRSTGTPSQKTITATLKTAYDILTAREDVDASKIIFYGRSLGGGAVCALAAERPPAAMILTSTFVGIRAMAVKYLVPGFLIRDPFDNLTVVRDFHGPLLIVHGRHDPIIPFAHGEQLHNAAKRSKLVAYDCGHNDCPPDWKIFWTDVAYFLRDAGIIG